VYVLFDCAKVAAST